MFSNKLKLSLLGLFLLGAIIGNSQVLNIVHETIIHNNKERSAIKVVIAPDSKEVKKAFRDYMADRYDVDVEGIGFLKNKEVIYTAPTVISTISTKKMELFAKVMSNGRKTVVYVFGQIGYNELITPMTHYKEYVGMKDLTIDFLNHLLPNYYQDVIDDQKEEVVDLEDDRDGNRKKNV